MKILVVTPDFPLWDGGISTVALEVSNGLQRLGHEIVVLAPSQDPGDREYDGTLPYETVRLRNVKSRHVKTLYHAWVTTSPGEVAEVRCRHGAILVPLGHRGLLRIQALRGPLHRDGPRQ